MDNVYEKQPLVITSEKVLDIMSGISKVNQLLIVRCCYTIPGADGRGAGFTHEESGGNDTNCWICLT